MTSTVLASVIPGTGHLLPLLPSLHALRTAGSAGQLGMFAQLAPAVVPDLLALADEVRPHLLLREP